MRKNDLKNRMIVELRNGNRYIVVDDILMRDNGWLSTIDYTDNLTHCGFFTSDENFDIMKVYAPVMTFSLNAAENCIWERNETELKPCPFCGGKAAEIELNDCNKYTVMCSCGAMLGWSPSIEEAIEKWNERK